MSTHGPALRKSAAKLHAEFDQSFAQQAGINAGSQETLLAVRIGGAPYALRITEIGGLYADRRIAPLPSPLAELLGIAGFRGQTAPVYDLAALLGYPRRPASRWMILLRHEAPLALSFEVFEGHLTADADKIVAMGHAPAGQHAPRSLLFDAVHTDEAIRPIIQLHLLLADIQQRVHLARPNKES